MLEICELFWCALLIRSRRRGAVSIAHSERRSIVAKEDKEYTLNYSKIYILCIIAKKWFVLLPPQSRVINNAWESRESGWKREVKDVTSMEIFIFSHRTNLKPSRGAMNLSNAHERGSWTFRTDLFSDSMSNSCRNSFIRYFIFAIFIIINILII